MLTVGDMRKSLAGSLILSGYLLLAGYATLHHEMWRDEIQAWLVARDSETLSDLQQNLKYEGHPGLWHLSLTPLTRISRNPELMQVWHLAIAVTTVFILLRYATLHPVHLILLPFGYFLLYEYAAISRNYALGLLLLTLVCALYRNRYRHFVLIGALLFLAAHVSVHTLIIVIAVMGALAIDVLLARKSDSEALRERGKQVSIGLALAVAGIVTSVLQLMPPPDSGYSPEWQFRWSFQRFAEMAGALGSVWGRSFDWIPIPFVKVPELARRGAQAAASLVVIFWMSYQLRDRWPILWMYLAGTFGLLAFFYVKLVSGFMHSGHLFIVFLMAVWLERSTRPPNRARAGMLTDSLVAVVLVSHLASGITPYAKDILRPFSNGKAVAHYVKQSGLGELPIVGYQSYAVSTVVGYLGVDSVYYAGSERWGSFVRWDTLFARESPDPAIINDARLLAQETRDSMGAALIISNRILGAEVREEEGIEEIRRFTGAIRTDENFSVYRVPQTRPERPSSKPSRSDR
jgi:hypothetical protein